MTRFGRIYIIRNKVNDKVYVGQTTVSIRMRFLNHLSAARRGKDYIIGKAIRKYGEENFYVELLEECLVSELNEREVFWISYFNSTDNKFGYNMSVGGNKVTPPRVFNESEILDLFNSGISAFKIAKQLHTAVFRITDILKKHNIKYGSDKQKISEEISRAICEMYVEGYGTMDVCRKFNVDKGTVRKILKNNNITLRTKQETNKLRRNLLTPEKVPHESLAFKD